ncbi:hypothetical protein QQ056_02015 [Oscillatoria laete-virens NRMC-F 0139]|nr:hypothetical protein [Oscillatoria laete-virens]MDL5052344.1 hypothetical protein [Oscillatoria laete-virens NRMC-F 0139]
MTFKELRLETLLTGVIVILCLNLLVHYSVGIERFIRVFHQAMVERAMGVVHSRAQEILLSISDNIRKDPASVIDFAGGFLEPWRTDTFITQCYTVITLMILHIFCRFFGHHFTLLRKVDAFLLRLQRRMRKI